nr:MAG TPA: hypothetical protein [Caudoviricetes sp.]
METPSNIVKIVFVLKPLDLQCQILDKRKAPRIAPRGLICFYRSYFRF